ncbi:MAG: IS110 family transposase, partial [Rhizobiales bacterium]|nr:IS110 family transposase [Hyphomicrobiales bacterium]
QVKKILFMVAMVAVRSNSKIKEFYDRLILNGKKKMVALTAAMRKIITILNAQIRDYYKIKQMS